jgi:acetylornithine/succinyldiaminopimelate/putrescine aminotransferase
MIGIELTEPGKEIFQQCLRRGLMINCTQERILRLAPPLTISDDDLSAGLDILTDVLKG